MVEFNQHNKLNTKIDPARERNLVERKVVLIENGLRRILEELKSKSFNGTFVWRNVMCNIRWDANKFYESNIDTVIREAGHQVLDSFKLSIGRLDAM